MIRSYVIRLLCTGLLGLFATSSVLSQTEEAIISTDSLKNKNQKDSLVSYNRNYWSVSIATNLPVGLFADTVRSRIQIDEPGYAKPGAAIFAERAFYPFPKRRYLRFLGWKANVGLYFNPFNGEKFASNVVYENVSPWIGGRLFTGPELSIPIRWGFALDLNAMGGIEALRSPRREGNFGPLGIAEVGAQMAISLGYSFGWAIRYDFDKNYFNGALHGKGIRLGREWAYASFDYNSATIGSFEQEVKQRRWYVGFIWYLKNKTKATQKPTEE